MNRTFIIGVAALATVSRADMILVNRTSTISIYSAPTGGDPISDTRVWESLDDWVEAVSGPLNAMANQMSFARPLSVRFVGEGGGGGGAGLGSASGLSQLELVFELAESHPFSLNGTLGGLMGHSSMARLTHHGFGNVFEIGDGTHALTGVLSPGQYEFYVSVGGGQSGTGLGDLTFTVPAPAGGLTLAVAAVLVGGRRRDRETRTYPPA